mmetsp:Transcript_3348/g.10452  ORF Transcript_3348/g.10452 Transcript_3348/m.10452 type:complete len:319 (-) Transcript_3348:492-1448(-)
MGDSPAPGAGSAPWCSPLPSSSSETSRTPFSRAWRTLPKPGSLPTTSRVVLPLTEPVTRPPKLAIIALTRSLPRLRPTPPPTSGKTPVSTHVSPLRLPSAALPRPGLGMIHLAPPPPTLTMAPCATAAPAATIAPSAPPAAPPAAALASIALVAAPLAFLAALPLPAALFGAAASAPSMRLGSFARAAAAASASFCALLLYFLAQCLRSMACMATSRRASSGSSSIPQKSTSFIFVSASTKAPTSWHSSGLGRPSHTLDGTRQLLRRFHLLYPPACWSSEPTRTAPLGISSPVFLHLERPDLASSTRYEGIVSSAAAA